jgi:hypothetical protein
VEAIDAMKQPVEYTALAIGKATSPCCNHCRFCLDGPKDFQNIPFDRFERIVERFIRWKEDNSLVNFGVVGGSSYTFMGPPEHIARRVRLAKRGGIDQSGDYFPLNGTILMPDDELQDWLIERRDAGVSKISLSFAGMGKFHDSWVGRRGEYNFLMRIAQIAAELGLDRVEKLYLTRSTIPQLESLMDALDPIPNRSARLLIPLIYAGFAKNLESERITEDSITKLSGRVLEYLAINNSSENFYKTEKTWIDALQNGYQNPSSYKKYLILMLREDNINEIETRSCGEIVRELKKKYDKVHAALPELNELCKVYGDISNTRLYGISELERKWTQSFLKENSQISIDDYKIANRW